MIKQLPSSDQGWLPNTCVQYLFSILHHTQYLCVGYIAIGSWKSKGNQSIQLAIVLCYKLLTKGKRVPAFPLEVGPHFKLQSQRSKPSVFPLCHSGSLTRVQGSGLNWNLQRPNKVQNQCAISIPKNFLCPLGLQLKMLHICSKSYQFVFQCRLHRYWVQIWPCGKFLKKKWFNVYLIIFSIMAKMSVVTALPLLFWWVTVYDPCLLFLRLRFCIVKKKQQIQCLHWKQVYLMFLRL